MMVDPTRVEPTTIHEAFDDDAENTGPLPILGRHIGHASPMERVLGEVAAERATQDAKSAPADRIDRVAKIITGYWPHRMSNAAATAIEALYAEEFKGEHRDPSRVSPLDPGRGVGDDDLTPCEADAATDAVPGSAPGHSSSSLNVPAAVMAVADEELADLRGEVTKWRLFAHGETIRAESAERELADLRREHLLHGWEHRAVAAEATLRSLTAWLDSIPAEVWARVPSAQATSGCPPWCAFDGPHEHSTGSAALAPSPAEATGEAVQS
jgi:hypothetical protein